MNVNFYNDNLRIYINITFTNLISSSFSITPSDGFILAREFNLSTTTLIKCDITTEFMNYFSKNMCTYYESIKNIVVEFCNILKNNISSVLYLVHDTLVPSSYHVGIYSKLSRTNYMYYLTKYGLNSPSLGIHITSSFKFNALTIQEQTNLLTLVYSGDETSICIAYQILGQ